MSGGSPRGRPARPSSSVDVRLLGQVLGAVASADELAHRVERVVRDARRVGTHVGDETDRAFVAELDALVEPLRDAHRAAGCEAELARRLLLQLRGDEGRQRVALDAPCVSTVATVQVARRRAVGELRGRSPRRCELLVLEPLAVDLEQPGGERRRRLCPASRASIVQYSSGTKASISRLALADQPHRDRLHAAGGQPAPHLLPEQRADLVADQAVEDAARLLGIELIAGRCSAGCSSASCTALLGDLVEERRDGRSSLPRRAPRRCARRWLRPRGRGRAPGRCCPCPWRPSCSSSMTFFLPWMTSYSGSKSFSRSTPSFASAGRRRGPPRLSPDSSVRGTC